MEDFKAIEANIKASLIATTRSANSLGSEDLAFHRSLDAAVGTAIDTQNARLLVLADRLVSSATANTEIVRPPRLRDLEAVESNWKAIVDVIDSLLERADTALDEFTGAVKRLSPDAEQAQKARPSKVARLVGAYRNQELQKPQLLFEHVPTNDEELPFKPLLLSKPHASVPLVTAPTISESTTSPLYPHPYQFEIAQYRYPSSVYTQSEPIMYQSFDNTNATFVDTEAALDQMLQELKQAKEVAIDLEHHDNRSYIGIVSLMQISTRNKDWIVDTLKPWRRKLQCLNEVFADPNILKVLHGAYMDVVWLQRDLGLYLVGLFDTYYAARALGYTGGSLAYLLKKFVNFDAQKQYQMADWRIRPLPKELFDYARSDTHFLLYIYDNMRNELVQRSDFSKPDHEADKLWYVLQNSTDCALQRYEHPLYDDKLGQGSLGWYKLLSKTSDAFSKEQFSVFRAVHKWRDDVARQQDDSVHFVMPNHNIFSLARAMPTTRSEVLNTTLPNTSTIRLKADELVAVVGKAKEAGRNGPSMGEILSLIDPKAVKRPTATTLEQRELAKMSANSSATERHRHPAPLSVTSTAPNGAASSIRALTSSFWGRTFAIGAREQKRNMAAMADIPLAVPLPPLTSEIFSTQEEVAPHEEDAPLPLKPSDSVKNEDQDNEVFVLKNLGTKRKRTDPLAPLDGMAANSDQVALPGSETARLQERRERKAAKRAAKKAAKGDVAGEIKPEESAIPIDYASAPSILNPPRETKADARERKKREKQKNPYAKAMDAPKGLPRVQKESAGKSMTFKS